MQITAWGRMILHTKIINVVHAKAGVFTQDEIHSPISKWIPLVVWTCATVKKFPSWDRFVSKFSCSFHPSVGLTQGESVWCVRMRGSVFFFVANKSRFLVAFCQILTEMSQIHFVLRNSNSQKFPEIQCILFSQNYATGLMPKKKKTKIT